MFLFVCWVWQGPAFASGSTLRTEQANALLKELPQMGALESRSDIHFFLADHDLEGFNELRSKGLARFVDETCNRIVATRRGAAGLGVLQHYHGPVTICHYVSEARASGDLTKITSFDLILMLLNSNWEEKSVMGKPKGRYPPYKPDGQKLFVYSKTSNLISKNYLLCLYNAPDLFSKGITEIHHLEVDAYYKALLQCQPGQVIHPGRKASHYREMLDGQRLRQVSGLRDIDDEGPCP